MSAAEDFTAVMGRGIALYELERPALYNGHLLLSFLAYSPANKVCEKVVIGRKAGHKKACFSCKFSINPFRKRKFLAV